MLTVRSRLGRALAYYNASYPPEALGMEAQPVTAYDPAENTVEHVKGHVGEFPDDLDRVLDAEREGKARTTLIAWLEQEQEQQMAAKDIPADLYKRVPDAQSPAAAAVRGDDQTEASAYDPGEASVEAVLKHVEDHPDQRAAVLKAERAGKARKGVLDHLGGDD
jgi:hypothetical protein